MTTIADKLAAYANAVRFEELPEDVVRLVKRHLIDALGCAIEGLGSRPAVIAREQALEVEGRPSASLVGTGERTSPEMAAFANGVAIRYLDFNDTYTSKELGHPSDMFAAVLAAAELAGSDGRAVIEGSVVAYEVFCRLADAANVRDRGFDYVIFKAAGAAAAVARMLGLSPGRTAEAISLAVTPNVGLFQTRLGDVSMWKGCASANACRNAVFAARLAAKDMTGPREVFEGRAGFFEAVSGGPFEPDLDASKREFRFREVSMKRFPIGHLGQTSVEAALEAQRQTPAGDPVASVHIETCRTAIQLMAGDDQKWRPQDRETADHSIPYAVAVALTHGTVQTQHFGDGFLRDPRLLDLVQKIQVTATDEAEALWPQAMLAKLELTTQGGRTATASVPHHRGHWEEPDDGRRARTEVLGPRRGPSRQACGRGAARGRLGPRAHAKRW